jgi:hypothetical protein
MHRILRTAPSTGTGSERTTPSSLTVLYIVTLKPWDATVAAAAAAAVVVAVATMANAVERVMSDVLGPSYA